MEEEEEIVDINAPVVTLIEDDADLETPTNTTPIPQLNKSRKRFWPLCLHSSKWRDAEYDPTRPRHTERHSHDRRKTSCFEYSEIFEKGEMSPFQYGGYVYSFIGYPRYPHPDSEKDMLPAYPLEYIDDNFTNWDSYREMNWIGPQISYERYPGQDPDGWTQDDKNPLRRLRLFRFRHVVPVEEYEDTIPYVAELEPSCYRCEMFLNIRGRYGIERRHYYRRKDALPSEHGTVHGGEGLE
ncbi:hypothetical protein TWF730_011275 [Orbilia blumenaviensis]|uniref:Uncharacterized protein n=1 Tax=Orbilia blumenaviensis TaxID=1796055 RepID=A0AAV9UR30_9PEZI